LYRHNNGTGELMKTRKRQILLCTAGILIGSLALLLPQNASGIAPLSGTWSCGAYASCVFQITTSNHAAYQWNFGDGSFSGLTTAATTWHTYNIPPTTTPQHFTVYLMGYATSSGGSPDNVVGCTITTYRTSVGGDPTQYSGNCND
jgi:hypothetical protein